MLSPNEGYNETGLTMQGAGPVREPWQPIHFEYMFKGSEFGHWRVKGGYDAFAFRHPSLGQTDVHQLLESEAHHHKTSPVVHGQAHCNGGNHRSGKSRYKSFASPVWVSAYYHTRTTKNKNELPAARIHRQCNPKAIEVAFLSVPAIEFFADEQLQVPQEWYLEQGQGLEAFDAAVRDDKVPCLPRFSFMTSGF